MFLNSLRPETIITATPDGTHSPERLRAVYIIPTPEGCLVADAHYTLESAEGFGARFRRMMNTLALL